MKSPSLFPVPRKMRTSKSRHDLRSRQVLRVDSEFDPRVQRALISFREEEGLSARVSKARPADDLILLECVREPSLPQEAYTLQLSARGILLQAGSETGALWGIQTVRQLFRQYRGVFPGLRIEDSPDFPNRGFMLDISRCKVPTRETLFELIDQMAALKLNQLQLYTEHTFAYANHETVWRDSSPLIAEDILAICDYAWNRGIEVVPNQNSFGHFQRWLKHPEYKHFAECPDGFDHPWSGPTANGSVLKPDAASLELLEGLFDELLPNFDSPWFNVGCDETWELGKGSSEQACERHGKGRVYLNFLLEIEQRVRERGKRMMFWGDIIVKYPELIDELPRGLVALAWGYEKDHPFKEEAAAFAKSGVPFYVCPGTSSWRSLVGRIPNMVGNLLLAAKEGLAQRAQGFLITDWGDCGHHQTLPITYPGLLAGACYSWAYKKNAGISLADGLSQLFFDEPSGETARLLLDMGSVYDQLPDKFSNSTPLFHLLFQRLHNCERVTAIKPSVWAPCEKQFNTMIERIEDCRPRNGALVREELKTNLLMAKAAAMRGQLLHGSGDAAEVKTVMRSIIDQHTDCWLARNQPGGLQESSNVLRNELSDL